ncbi:KilA-N domain-containing protein [Achromobacter xylosoxidans]|uniref:KilA-N domain-containing protein n=1 Tax=Alcaligenes xylosoxydans xylosoxydans TaxID=85698 RepID=UPI0004AF0AAC|nr:KilA-N domain-containing protein [Achromobacter xylosoxidans]
MPNALIPAPGDERVPADVREMFLRAEAGDGFFYATGIAKRYGKEPHEWLRLPKTCEWLAAVSHYYEIPVDQCVRTKRGGEGKGTWLHRALRGPFAQWLDVDLSVWVDMQRAEAWEKLINSGEFAAGLEMFAAIEKAGAQDV